ncbi:MAG TPA: hypothetical protein VNO81_04145 [Candidatus Nitrosotenuis sp.]|jgi:type II secretory pathway component PulJ|nr:hypothetical protein [Candidatus Nitrosotenuis sp.]
MNVRRGNSGFSLVELIVYSALFPVVLAAIYAVLTLCTRYYAALDNQATLGQQALTASARLAEDVSGTALASVRVESDGIVFLSARGAGGQVFYDSSGRLLWLKYVCYYRTGTVLYRKEQSITATPDVPALTPAVSAFAGNSSLPTTQVAREVTALSISPGSTVAFTVTTSNDLYGGCLVSVSDRVRLRQ